MPPTDLLGLERRSIRSRLGAVLQEPGEQRPSKATAKSEARNATIGAWQARWQATSKAAWTGCVVPDLGRWLGRTVPWVPLTFHMAQALTGHGCFQWYLHRMGMATSPRCWQCADDSDTAEHTLFQCVYWEGFREALTSRLGHRPNTIDVSDIIYGPVFETLPLDPIDKQAVLIEAEEVFKLFYRMVENILTTKEDEERRRQAAERPPNSPN
ncbi:PREDICTED: retrovirus-related Pol polyprotein from type-1 retrotransposable element R1 2 isoform X1 [Diuraphis noxia]|uniref:retrovirus-related Pol polyprotein from type-1 retrotransposable element R1 2 isoform X1 n=1 Tax=Diuraphis noxia TaxID=143948 RepID=UPI0007636519|nr:PREDICTED: retrovirus-related Pol polyprotein from type-1 retrotransposable element R1 2 isoform X1 [Diuraphis noxia]